MNIEYFTVKTGTGEDVEMVNLVNEDGSFTQMTKEHYDTQQAAIPTTIGE